MTTLGPGVRAGVWVQGCTIACPGCAATDTWSSEPGAEVRVETVLGWLASLDGPVDGVTISGGEPFQQPDAVGELIAGIRAWAGERPVDVLAYSGYTLSRLRARPALSALVDACDAVVTGPYARNRPDGGWLRGSDNQVLTVITPLGRDRYGGDPPDGPRLQMGVEGERVYLIGVPRRDDLDRTAEALRRAGVPIEEASWRT
ncbi:4Fe-4S single cluster domain-containing protein [Acrocarpospora corrugata]|uniref:4Fe-4S single cluster domain-containing protein n=1 Tax=Acrocarpospora corrugata TaxID=35763 RepID=UPI001FEA6A14|nr:4Fe-4S single cluster domain-containing protein [Acrocarpospora corrugata]